VRIDIISLTRVVFVWRGFPGQQDRIRRSSREISSGSEKFALARDTRSARHAK
jgi:hypothetical protein